MYRCSPSLARLLLGHRYVTTGGAKGCVASHLVPALE